METIEEIEKKLTDYENQYISENQTLIEKLNLYAEREKQYKEHIISLYNKLDELNIINNNECKKSELNYIMIKEENLRLKDNYMTLKNNFDLLKKELNKEISKNEILIDKYNKLSLLYEQQGKTKENITLHNCNNDLNNYNDSYDNEKIIFYCNNTLSMIIKWIDNNFISLYDYSNNLNNSQNENLKSDFINIDKNDLFIFDKLRDSLLIAKNTIEDYYNKINIELKKEKEKINDIEKQNIELNNFLENLYQHLYEEIEKEKYFEINKNMNNKYEVDKLLYFSEIENIVDNIFILLKKIKESSFNKSLDKLIEDNIILNKENEKYKMKIVDLYNDNKIILEKNNELHNINEELKQQLSNRYNNKNT